MAGGQSFSGAQGSFGRAVSIALIGIAIAVSPGDVGSSIGEGDDITAPLVGAVITSSNTTGSGGNLLAPYYERAAVGQEITPAVETIAPTNNPSTSDGQVVNGATGTLSASGDSVTVNISGSEAEFSQGIVTGGTQFLVGEAATSAAGTLVPHIDITDVTGIGITSGLGLVVAGLEADDTFIQSGHGLAAVDAQIPLVGHESTASQGDLTVTGDSIAELTGEESTAAAGDVGFAFEFELEGIGITGSQQNIGAPGYASLTGQAITSEQGFVFLDEDRSYALVGQSLTASAGITFASSLGFATGQVITVGQQEIGPRWVLLTGQQISSQHGDLEAPRGHRHGKSKKPKKHEEKRLVVEIDGEDFFVDSKEAAEELLREARSTYIEQIDDVTTQLIKKAANPAVVVKPVRMPRIRAVGPEGPELDALIREVASLRTELKALYEQTAAVQKKIINDDEEALALLI